MSGGAYDYAYVRVQGMADALEEALPNLPARGRGVNRPLRKRVIAHLRDVAELMRALEWEDSGDGAGWEDLRRAEELLLHEYGVSVPDQWEDTA